MSHGNPHLDDGCRWHIFYSKLLGQQRLYLRERLGSLVPCHFGCEMCPDHLPSVWYPGPALGVGGALGPTYNSRFEGWLDLLLLQEHPVDLLEERVLLDGVLAILCCHTAQALVGVLGHELQG